MDVCRKKVFDNVTISSDKYSDILSLENTLMWSVHFIATGTPVGFIYAQVSNDGINWETITSATKELTGAPATHFVDYTATGAEYMRFFYDYSSSTGVLLGNFCGKGA